MSQFLETLKARLVDSQRRLQLAQQKLNQAQIEHQASMTEFSSWQNAVSVEARRENPNIPPDQTMVLSQQPGQQPRIITRVVHQQQQPANGTVVLPVSQPSPANQAEQVNKTDLVREVLRQHPNGIRPADIWKQVRENVGRAYLYSVLNRLKEKKQVSERRGKYFLQVIPKSEDAKENTQVQ